MSDREAFPDDGTEQAETQEHDPLTAEIGEDGQGDLSPEDEPDVLGGDAPEDLRTEDDVEDVPAGGAGADSGAAETVRIDPEDEASVSGVSSMNDIAGVGTRGPEDDREQSGRS